MTKPRLAVVTPGATLGSFRIGVDRLVPADAGAHERIPALTEEADLRLRAAASGSLSVYQDDALLARACGITTATVSPAIRRVHR